MSLTQDMATSKMLPVPVGYGLMLLLQFHRFAFLW
jgi:hypothetical protein